MSNRVSRRQANRWAQQDQQQYAAQQYEQQQYQQPVPQQVAQPQADDMDAKIAQIKQLGELKEQGLLSEAEFQAQKSRLLGI